LITIGMDWLGRRQVPGISLLLTRTELKTLPLGLYHYWDDSVDWGAIMAASVVTTLPGFLLFLPIQGGFRPGRTIGAVK